MRYCCLCSLLVLAGMLCPATAIALPDTPFATLQRLFPERFRWNSQPTGETLPQPLMQWTNMREGGDCTAIEFSDAALEGCVRRALGKPSGDICPGDVSALTHLDASHAGITALDGLESCTSLRYLNLYGNAISDLSPLAALTELRHLNLGLNALTSVEELAGLEELVYLQLGAADGFDADYVPDNTNAIDDLGPLAGLTRLVSLGLRDLGVEDIAFLECLSSVRQLDLAGNPITDFAPVAALSRLELLDLSDTPLTDESAAALAGCRRLMTILLTQTALTHVDFLAGMRHLSIVIADNCPELCGLSALAGLQRLAYVSAAHTAVADLATLADIPTLRGVDASFTPLTDLTYFLEPPAAVYLRAWGNTFTVDTLCTQAPQFIGNGNTLAYDGACDAPYNLDVSKSGEGDLSIPPGRRVLRQDWPVTIEAIATDPAWAFEAWTGSISGTQKVLSFTMDEDKSIEAVFSPAEWELLVRVHGHGDVCPGKGPMGYLDGQQVALEALPDAGWTFDHWEGALSGGVNTGTLLMDASKDVTAVFAPLSITFEDAALEAAVRAALGQPTGILTADVLAELTELQAPDCGITSLSGLEWCRHLEVLNVFNNAISDLSPLEGLEFLRMLNAGANAITDIAPLAGLTDMAALELGSGDYLEYERLPESQNAITDLSPLAALTDITYLGLAATGVEDLTALAGMTQMTCLWLQDNPGVTSFEPLSALASLQYLNLANTGLSSTDFAALPSLADLMLLNISGNPLANMAPAESMVSLIALVARQCPNLASLAAVSGLSRLAFVDVSHGATASLAPLAGLEQLQYLHCVDTAVSNLAPLAALAHIRRLEISDSPVLTLQPLTAWPTGDSRIEAWGCPLDSATRCTHIPALEANGHTVGFDGACSGATHTLTIAVQGEGTVFPPAGVREFEANVSAVLSARDVNATWGFSHWQGDASGTNADIGVMMNADKAVTAVFSPADYWLKITGTDGGNVTPVPGYHGYLSGHTATISAAPDVCYHFERWTGSVTSTTPTLSVAMNANTIAHAVFVPNTPAAEITVEPASIMAGESAHVTWSAEEVTACNISPGIGAVALSGECDVSPGVSTAYTLSATGPGGAATATATLTVNHLPSVTLSISPNTYTEGQPCTLTWTSEYADSCAIDQGIGAVTPNGSTSVTPQEPAVYTITAINAFGTATASAVVRNPQPEDTFGAAYETLIPPSAHKEAYDPARFAIITGAVKTLAGAPLPGVTVRIQNHAEYGHTTTGTAGTFALPVEGGGQMTVACEKEGYITAFRSVLTPWEGYAAVDEVTLIPPDAEATEVVVDGNPASVTTHTGAVTEDAAGERACSMVFRGDNAATAYDANGSAIGPLQRFEVTSTEFPTEAAMPAQLPPATAFTYCVELSARDTAGNAVPHVVFEEPVVCWVDNFLGFTVGYVVPVGSYDPFTCQWTPEENGRVVRLLDTDSNGTVDALDTDGDALPDDVNGNGSVADEVAGIAGNPRYAPGATFWRFHVTHLSIWDCNWPYQPEPGSVPPNPPGGPGTGDGDPEGGEATPPHHPAGCHVDYRTGVFHEDVAIPGTSFSLHYASNRTNGYRVRFHVPLAGGSVPAPLRAGRVEISVGGRKLQQRVQNVTPNHSVDIDWDGLDFAGNPVTRTTLARVRIGYEYDGVYKETPESVNRAFGALGDDWEAANTSRSAFISWASYTLPVTPRPIRDAIAEGWSLSVHHELDPEDISLLHHGDGTLSRGASNIIRTVAGTGAAGTPSAGVATSQNISCPESGLCTDAAGNVYFITNGHLVCRVTPGGMLTRLTNGAMTNSQLTNLGDGGPSTAATTRNPKGLAVDSDGNLYIADTGNYRIRRIATDGIITTFATGFANPVSLAFDPSGNLFVLDTGAHQILQITSAGERLVLVETNPPLTCTDIATDAGGNVYYVDNHRYVRKIVMAASAGPVSVFGYAPDETHPEGETPVALQEGAVARLVDSADFQPIYRVDADAAGNLYVASKDRHRVFKIDPAGRVYTAAGTGATGVFGDGGPAAAAASTPQDIASDAAGNLYINDNFTRIRKADSVTSAFAGVVASGAATFADPAGVAHVFSALRRHVSTVDIDTAKTLLQFGYDDAGRLTTVTDRFGRATAIARDANGRPTAITSPDGVVTTLTVDTHNHLTDIEYPAGGHYAFTYAASGLMTAEDANGRTYLHRYDATGRIRETEDPLGAVTVYSHHAASNTDLINRLTTAEGDITEYQDHYTPAGAFSSTITWPGGEQQHYQLDASRMRFINTLPDGLEVETLLALDPVRHVKYINRVTAATPGGYTLVCGLTRAKTGAAQYTDTCRVNGLDSTIVTNTGTGVVTATSAEGRQSTLLYDTDTLLPLEEQAPGLFPVTYAYDSGVLSQISMGGREITFDYHGAGPAKGLLECVTGPDGRTTHYGYDADGRIAYVISPGNSRADFVHDPSGRMTVLTTPSRVDHEFAYNAAGLATTYQPPLSAAYGYAYDRDHRLTRVTYPSGREIRGLYEHGRVQSVQTPEGSIDLTYNAAGQMTSITKGPDTLEYTYDGPLMTQEVHTGTLPVTFACGYDDTFQLTSFAFTANTHTVTTAFTYDDDGLLTAAGAYTIQHHAEGEPAPGDGMPWKCSNGTALWTRDFNGHGEIMQETLALQGTPVYAWDLARDAAGRIIANTETLGATVAHAYEYDANGHLACVRRNGSTTETYTHGANGARATEVNTLRGIQSRTFTYDDEDRLLSVYTNGIATSYQWDQDGFLTRKTRGAEITQYTYSSRGELMRVLLPDGRQIDYARDPLGRRIEKRVNGAVAARYLWAGPATLLAVYRPGQPPMHFEYADGRTPLAVVVDGIRYYLAADPTGTLHAVFDSAGTCIKRLDYDVYGNRIADTNPALDLPLGFAGGLYDADTRLVLFAARDYDPDTGRWIAKDPVLFACGEYDLYAYCLGDPVNFVDPLGLDAMDSFLYGAAQFSAGMGDTISFGLTCWIREYMDTNFVVNEDSGYYISGEITGIAVSTAMGSTRGMVVGRRLQGIKPRPNKFMPYDKECVERSHWIIPQRARWAGSIRNMNWNIKLMWGRDHAMADPYRYRPLKVPGKSVYKLKGPWAAFCERTPEYFAGGVYGSLLGTGQAMREHVMK